MPDAETTLSVRLLGPVDAAVDGRPVELGGPRQRRMLAVLAMRVGERVDSGEVIDAVWADDDLPPDPRETLRTYASRLRRALGDPALLTAGSGTYSLRLAPEAIDAHAFESLVVGASNGATVVTLRQALALWHGPALAGFEHEAWARAFVARLTELRHATGDNLGRGLLDAGEVGDAVALLEGLAAGQPLRERTHRLLMQALHQSGRSGEAVRAFQAYRRRLATELGLEPSDAIILLERAILAGDQVSGSPSSSVSPAADTNPANQSGRAYELLERIGEGAFAVVYRGTQAAVDRDVAIKVIRRELANRPEFIRRFEAEAHLVARLEHPHVVPLYDYWREPGSAWLVMRLLRGGTLGDRLAGGPLPLADVITVVDQIGGALAAAHRAGVVHRDVKPANVFLDGDGHVFLGDFGIADGIATAHIGSSPSVGSPAYASPEQLRREPVGPATDVHGLAITVYQCLTGRLPFDDSHSEVELLDRQLNAPIPSVRRLRAEVPARVDEVLARATEKQPQRRYADVTLFVDDLVAALKGRTAPAVDRLGPTTAAVGPFRNPYKGLLPFHEADAVDFFGRTRLVDRLLERIGNADGSGRFVALIGPSGGGKSSVIRAGVLPALRAGAVPGSQHWYFTAMLPSSHPFEELEAALSRVSGGSVAGLAEMMAADGRGIGRAVKQILPDEDGELLLVIDQFEELFTLCRDEAMRQAFIAGIVAAVTNSRSRLRVVITMRADFYDRPLRSPQLAALFERGAVSLAPLAADELEQVIVDPAARVGATFEPGLVARIAADVADQPGGLPLLQYALTELFDRHSSGMLTLSAYEEFGGLAGAIARRAEALYVASSPPEREVIRRLFTRLTTPGEGVEDTRRRVLRTELSASVELDDQVVEAYGAARLLAFDRDRVTRTPTIEVAHEALLREWPRLRRWLDEDRDGLRLQRHLTMSASAWEASDREVGELYRGSRLESATAWAVDRRAELNISEAAFLDASAEAEHARKSAEQRSRRRFNRLFAGVAAVAVIALLAGGLAFQQRAKARAKAEEATVAAFAAETERLAASAATLSATNLRVAFLVAAEAYRRAPGPKGLGALERVLVASRGLVRFVGDSTPAETVVWIDHQRLAVGRRGSLDIYTDRGDKLVTVPGITPTAMEPSSDGRTLVVGSAQGVRLLDLETVGLGPPILSNEFVQAVAWRGEEILVGTRSGLLITLDRSGRELDRVTAHPERTAEELDIDGVTTRIIPHLPATAVRGVASITVDPSSKRVATAGFGYARLWEPVDGTLRRLWQSPLTFEINDTLLAGAGSSSEFGADGRLLTADTFQIWAIDASTGVLSERAPIRERLSFVTQGDTATPLRLDGGRLLTAFSGGFVTVGRRGSDEDVGQVQHGVGEPKAIDVAGDRVIVAGSEGVALLSLRGDGPISRVIEGVRPGDFSVSRDGGVIASSDAQEYRAHVWRITDSGAEEIGLDGLEPFFIYLGVKEDQGIAIDYDHGLVLFDATTGGNHRHVESWDGSRGGNPMFSPDGSRLVMVQETGRLALIDIATGHIDRELEGIAPFAPPFLPAMAFDRSSSYFYAIDESGELFRWDLASGRKTALGNVGADAGGLAVGPNGEFVTAHRSGAVIVRDPVTLQPTGQQFDATRPGYAGVGYSEAGTRLATFFGREMRIWDLATGEVIGDPLPSDENSLTTMSANGEFGMTVVNDQLVRWMIHDARWPEIACDAAGRDMTPAEWTRFGPRDAEYSATCQDLRSQGFVTTKEGQ